MTLVAVRINSVVGAPTPPFDGEGNPLDEDNWDFDDANEDIVYVDTEDIWDIENGVADIKDSLRNWVHHDKSSTTEAR